jgi:hypothetical protein
VLIDELEEIRQQHERDAAAAAAAEPTDGQRRRGRHER